MKRRMNSGIIGNKGLKSIRIRRFQLGQRPVLQNLFHNRIIRCQLVQYICRRGKAALRPLSAGKLHLLKEHLPKLLRACNVKGVSRLFMDGFLKLCNPSRQLISVGRKLLRNHADADSLHIIQNIGKRKLHPLIELQHFLFFQLLPDRLRFSGQGIGNLCGKFCHSGKPRRAILPAGTG